MFKFINKIINSTRINNTELYNLKQELFELRCFKKCSMDFMKSTGINPISIGLSSFCTIDNVYTYSFNKEECEYLNQKFDIKYNPIMHSVYSIIKKEQENNNSDELND